MKALILAAGYGNRMRPLTDSTHKTLLEIGGRSIIERIIDGLSDNLIRDIIIVTGYRADELKSYLYNKYPEINFTFVHNSRYRETNNIYSVALVFKEVEIDDDLVLIESDLIYDPLVIQRLLKSKHNNVALVDKWRSGMDGTVVTVENELVTQVIPTHLQGSAFDFSDKYKTLNIYKFSKEFCNHFFKKLLTYYANVFNDNCYYELILGILIYMQEVKIYAEILDGEKWAEVDDPNDLRVAEFVFNDNQRLAILENTFGGYWSHDVLDFCFLRNMYFPTPSMISEMRNNLPNLIQNYGSRQDILNQKLAYFLLYKREYLNVLNGASQIYPILQNYFRGQRVLMPQPTFGEYPRIFPTHDVYGDKVGINIDEISDKVKTSDLVVIVNPNNPTGTTLDSGQIIELINSFPQKIFLVDESFIEFSRTKSVISHLEDHGTDNVIVIKSLSKVLGIPGLRLGYVYTHNKAFNEHLKSVIPIWNLNSIAEFFLEIILKHRRALSESFDKTIQDRNDFALWLSKLDFVERVYPSGGNFILISLKKPKDYGRYIVDLMLKKYSIYLKDVSNKFSDEKCYFRLAVRLPHENARLVELLVLSI